MKNSFLFYALLLSASIWLSTACEKKAEKTDEQTTQESTNSTDTKNDNTAPAEDKSRRPSPPDSVVMKVGASQVKIVYSKPSVKGRKVWGDLVPYGEVWRTGANEATVFETSADIMVQGKKLPAGKYALFTIPDQKSWTVIFNKVYDQWGSFKYDDKEDALRASGKGETVADHAEVLTFAGDEKTGKITLRWEKMQVSFDLAAAK